MRYKIAKMIGHTTFEDWTIIEADDPLHAIHAFCEGRDDLFPGDELAWVEEGKSELNIRIAELHDDHAPTTVFDRKRQEHLRQARSTWDTPKNT